ncbi:MAG TPA: energy-coupling factor ABC transporter permease [Bryobacteraceae bacterium]|jgi:cobalt/nickel transport system permease protein|nr:energy-coupling factor ABC transporter permease [Bryobacteraceae bacterium]
MHIPDGFLSTPVWAALDAAAVPAISLVARRSQERVEEARLPLMGVMGAFVFAAQMINFPVGLGTSGHLIGSTLLALTLGPASASLVMTAILIIQALVFQDGGVLALGANITNMAMFGVIAGYLPYQLFGSGKHRGLSIFVGGVLSVMVSAIAALSELLISGIRIPLPMLAVSIGVFAISAVIEGAITLALIQSLERLNPGFVQRPSASGKIIVALGALSFAVVLVGVAFASQSPDGLQKLAEQLGLIQREVQTIAAPVPDYELGLSDSPWLRKASAGLVGLMLVYAAALCFSYVSRARRAGSAP